MNKLVSPTSCLLAAALLFSVTSAQATPLDDAQAAFEANEIAQAAALLEPLTQPQSTDAAAFHLLSQVRLAQKNAADAVALAERATELDATKPAHFSQLGIALSQRIGEVGFIQKAIISGKIKSAFTKALELDANDLSALIGLARFYTHAPEIAGGSLVKARELAERVRQLHPFRGELELGHIAAQGEQPAEALKHFEAAAQLQPNSINAHYSCGQMLAKLGRKEEARARFETVLKISAGFEPARKSLAALGAPSS